MKLLLVFVEGEHDVVWTERSLRIHQGYKEFERAVRDYPTPVGGEAGAGVLVRQLVHIVDQRLTNAKRPPLPRLEATLHHEASETLALVMQMAGVGQLTPVTDFLGRLFLLLSASSYDVTACAVAVLVDADEKGVTVRESELAASLRGVYTGAAALSHGAWQRHANGPLGVWIFHDAATQKGSLEDSLRPVVSTALRPFWTAAEGFIDGVSRIPPASLPIDGNPVARFKGILTAAGQFHRPGAAMHGMLAHGVLPGDAIKASPEAQALALFLGAPAW